MIIILLCAVAVAPLLRADSPCTHDGGLHYYRVVAMRHALQDGSLFTRYLPDMAFGYGYPFFNYRAPLSYYLALLLYLTGLSLPAALNAVYVLSIAGSALAAYLLARDLFGHRAGLIAAIAYAYVPYQFLDALLRANMPESVALPLMPLVLWAFRRLALTGQKRWFLAGIASLSALLLTHNISSLLFAPVLFAYLAVLWLVYRRDFHWMTVGIALALAFGLTAFFWGPALLEQDYVQLHMSRTTRNNDFHYNFVTLAEIFAPPAPVDTSLMNPPMRIHLGLAQAALAAAGLIVGILKSKIQNPKSQERRASLIFFAVLAVFMIFMSTRASLWLWERVPLLPFVQFPWRLVGRAALPVALLASVPFATPELANSQTRKPASYLLPLASCLLPLASCFLILTAFPATYPPHGYCPNAPYPAIDDLFAYEHSSKLVGVDPEGSYFPVWVEERPEGSPLEAQYGAAGPVARFDETALPDGGFVVESDYGINQARLVVESPVPFRARYLAFYFPGWRVTGDGESVPVAPTDPGGLIAFDLPAGRHTVTVRFGETYLRLTADAISLFSLAVILAFALRYPHHAPRVTRPVSHFTFHASRFMFYVLAAIILLAAKLAIVDRADTIFRRPVLQPDGSLPGVERPLNRSYADNLTLIGYDQNQAEMPADGTLRLDLYWTAVTRPTARYQTVIHLVGSDGLRWSQPDSFRPRDYADHPPTTTWDPGRYALDSHEVEPLPGAPPGDYDIVLTVFDRDTLSPLSVLNEQGQPAAPTLTLGQVTLTRPRRPAELPEDNRLDISHMQLVLATADFDRDQAAPGDSAYLTLMWQSNNDSHYSTPYGNWVLTLLAPDNTAVARYSLPLPGYSWQEGDVWRSQHHLLLPATLETGIYTWTVEWSSLSSDPIGQISIVAPSHTFTAPPVDVETDIRLGGIATLLGATCELADLQPGTPFTVTLVWRAEETPSASYHVFLHLLGPEGGLIAQSDSIPANWTRPTTGWLPGEYITGTHTLAIPPDAPAGEYALLAGLYLPGGERLVTPNGETAVSLATFQIEAP